MVGLREVAERSGVSMKTVSNVIHGQSQRVSATTTRRVLKAIEDLNYSPNLSARTLRTGRSNQIGLVLPELDLPYFAELTRCVVEEARQRAWAVFIEQTDHVRQAELDVLSGRTPRVLDGLIFSPTRLTVKDLNTHHKRLPLVLIGGQNYAGPTDHVAIDNVAAARDATNHLLAIGRGRIAAIGARRTAGRDDTAPLRAAGYRQALRAAGKPVDRRLIVPVDAQRPHDGDLAIDSLLDLRKPPDAIFCFNDPLAVGALHGLRRRGYRVPDDIAVMGFDNIDEARFTNPTLSTIAADKSELARTALELLRTRISGEHTGGPRKLATSYQLTIRESTGGP